MTASRCVVPACALVMAACGGQGDALLISSPRTDDPVVFAVDLWPGEGIPVIEMQRTSLPLHAQPDPAAAVVDTLRGRIGQRVAFDSTRYQTIESGTIEAVEPLQISGRALGELKHLTHDQYYHGNRREVSIPLDAHTTIDFLQYRAEGTCFVRVAKQVIDAQPCPGFGKDSVTVVREPVTRWWVFSQGSGGARGWLLVSDSTARSVRREF